MAELRGSTLLLELFTVRPAIYLKSSRISFRAESSFARDEENNSMSSANIILHFCVGDRDIPVREGD